MKSKLGQSSRFQWGCDAQRFPGWIRECCYFCTSVYFKNDCFAFDINFYLPDLLRTIQCIKISNFSGRIICHTCFSCQFLQVSCGTCYSSRQTLAAEMASPITMEALGFLSWTQMPGVRTFPTMSTHCGSARVHYCWNSW